jgi:hypothetical protein
MIVGSHLYSTTYMFSDPSDLTLSDHVTVTSNDDTMVISRFSGLPAVKTSYFHQQCKLRKDNFAMRNT